MEIKEKVNEVEIVRIDEVDVMIDVSGISVVDGVDCGGGGYFVMPTTQVL